MKIGIEEAGRIATLAHLRLDGEELERLALEMSAILSWADQLSELDLGTTGEGATPRMPLREDLPSAALDREDVQENAPSWRDGFFVVPRVIGGE